MEMPPQFLPEFAIKCLMSLCEILTFRGKCEGNFSREISSGILWGKEGEIHMQLLLVPLSQLNRITFPGLSLTVT